MNPPPENIVLIGYMGTGKSSIGRQISRMTGMDFVDTDEIIVEGSGLSIPEIFEKHGQEEFRRLETNALASLTGCENKVVATGGGIVTQPRNHDLLRKLGMIIWLCADEDAIFERVTRNANRPLMQTEDPRATLKAMLEERRPLYEELSSFCLNSTWLRQHELAGAAINEFSRRRGPTADAASSPKESKSTEQ